MTAFASVAATADAVAAASGRVEKRDHLAALLRTLRPDEVVPTVGFLVGRPRQGRVGIGWATVADVSVPAATAPSLEVLDVDHLLDRVLATTGAGSQGRRRDLLCGVLAAATPPEQELLRRLLVGEMRQGALDGVAADAVAAAADVPAALVRRAAMLSGDLGRTAAVALADGRAGLAAIGLSVGTPLQPMLASGAPDVAAALGDDEPHLVSVEWKLDGIRIQVHRDGRDVAVFTRNLNDITDQVPRVVEAIRALPAERVVLDGEVVGSPHLFDVLHHDGVDLIDRPLLARLEVLDAVAGPTRIPRRLTDDPAVAATVMEEALTAGHEGVVVKDADSPYAAGRRGKAWRKVKPVHTVDLVVLAAEWGSGRRRGWLSNLHLGARVPASTDRFVMVGKTFKGLTDDLLAWQTTQLLARETGRRRERGADVVEVRPELVVEIALDGVFPSTTYPGGVALRFARVRRYRPDRSPTDADTLDALAALLPPPRPSG